MHRSLVFVFCTLVLAACLTIASCASQPAIDDTAIKTAAAGTAYAQLTEIANVTAPPVPTIPPTAITEPTITRTPPQNRMPTLEPTKVPGLLQSGLKVEKLDVFNGHALQKVTGWNYGFDGFEWMGTSHLLLLPVVGQMFSEGRGDWKQTHPTVINLNSKAIWLPSLGEVSDWNKFYGAPLLRWSAQLGFLISTQLSSSENDIVIYDANGNVVKMYTGKLLGISPSGTKIMIADDTWIDLSTEKIVDFNWYQNFRGRGSFSFRPIWSADETRVYTCCYLYGDAKTGESFGMPYDNYTLDGENGSGREPIYNFLGTWVLSDKYLLSQWGGALDGSPGFIPLFDPAAKTYRNLSKLAGIPYGSDDPGDPTCRNAYAAPGGRYVWVGRCDPEADYLIDLTTFKSTSYPPYFVEDINWSSDGKFALIRGEETGSPFVRLLSGDTKELKPLPDNHYCSWWHPTDNILACRSKDAKTLSLLDVHTMSVQKETALPVEIQKLIWNLDGKHIAVLARDSSLWQIDYPTLENLEQLTPAMPELTHPAYGRNIDESLIKNVTWSPEGTFLAFIGDLDIYIVETQIKP